MNKPDSISSASLTTHDTTTFSLGLANKTFTQQKQQIL
jgi:hypothetical protein